MKPATLRHDLQQPMTTLRTFLRHLPEKKDDPDFMRDFYQYTQQALNRLEILIDQIDTEEPS